MAPWSSNAASERSLRPFRTTEGYLLAVREDLAEWLSGMYPDTGINTDSFFSKLETGVLLCKHINNLIDRLKELTSLSSATRNISCRTNVQPGTFHARDNICNCLKWCREMHMKECLLFETDDLVLRKNEKSVVLCLMEIARIGAKLGFAAPTLIQLEKEIDAEELRTAADSSYCEDGDEIASSISISSSDSHSVGSSSGVGSAVLPTSPYLKNVDQVVKEHVKVCRCKTPFPLIKVAPGKYRLGHSQLVIYVRILRNHVMVRVGGGWDTLDHFLEKHDPCRRRGCCGVEPASKPPLTAIVQVKPQPTQLQPLPARKTSLQTSDLTPIQVFYKHQRESLSAGFSVTTAQTAVNKTEPSVAYNKAPPESVRRRISHPQTKVQVLMPANNKSKIPRARSMDVGLLLDQHSKAAKQVVKRTSELTKTPGKFVKTLRSEPLQRPALRSTKTRLSLMELEDISSGRRSRNVAGANDGVSAPSTDPWDSAYNRHREKFLRMKEVFDVTKTGSKDLGSSKVFETTDALCCSSRSSPDSDSTRTEKTSVSSAVRVKLHKSHNRRDSAEEGFYSDASCISDNC